MTMHINFIQRRCLLCGRYISVPNFSRHLEACERKCAEAQLAAKETA